MRKVFSLVSLLTLLACTASAASAAPIVVDSTSDDFTVLFNGSDDDVSDVDAWLKARAFFDIVQFSANQMVINVTVTNQTQAPYASLVTGMGFDLDPDPSGGSVTGVFTTVAFNEDFQPHGVTDTFDVCVKNGAANNCHGSSGGVASGASGQFTLTLNFSQAIAGGVSFQNFVVRYQGITYPQGETGSGSGAGIGCIAGVDDECVDLPPCTGPNCPRDTVPEPTTMALLGLGLLGAGIATRRRR